LKDISGSYGTGLLCFAFLMVASVLVLLEFGVQWRSTWTAAALDRTMVFSYRGSRQANVPDPALACEMDSAGD
jgi:hypothetical protein